MTDSNSEEKEELQSGASFDINLWTSNSAEKLPWEAQNNYAGIQSTGRKSYDEAEITVQFEDDTFDMTHQLTKNLTICNSNSMENINKFNLNNSWMKTLNFLPQTIEKRKIIISKAKIRKTINKFRKSKPITEFNDFPMYLGYYFREAYRNAVSGLVKCDYVKSDQMLKLLNDSQTFVIEDEIFLPDMSSYLIEQNQLHVTNSLQGLSYINSMVQDTNNYKSRKVRLPKTTKSKLAVFDLDETLIHCIPYAKYKANPKLAELADVVLDWNFTPDRKLYINIRPYMIECLEAIKEDYQIVVFTASQQMYADTILNFLDPRGEIFEARLYRGSWYTSNELAYVKDLRIFEDQWDLKDVILIDNSTYSIGIQVDNGFPILSYYDHKEDREMVYLHYFLKRISREYDFRQKLRNTFWLSKLRVPTVCDSIAGVVEYVVEEVGDEVLEKTANKKEVLQVKNTPWRRSSRNIGLTPSGIKHNKENQENTSDAGTRNNESCVPKLRLYQVIPKIGDSLMRESCPNDTVDIYLDFFDSEDRPMMPKDLNSEVLFTNLSETPHHKVKLNFSRVENIDEIPWNTSHMQRNILGVSNWRYGKLY